MEMLAATWQFGLWKKFSEELYKNNLNFMQLLLQEIYNDYSE